MGCSYSGVIERLARHEVVGEPPHGHLHLVVHATTGQLMLQGKVGGAGLTIMAYYNN